MNDKTEQALTDALIDQIESAARESFRRHQRSIKGQTLTAADNYDWHLLHAAYQAGIHALLAQLAEAQRERDKAIDLLETMFSSYENGTACYEDPEDCSGFVGYAFKMDDLDFNACCDLLNRTRPRAAAAELRRLHAENEALRKANAEAIRLLEIGLRNVANSLDKSIERAYAGKSDSGATVSSLTDAMSAMYAAITALTAAAREAQATDQKAGANHA